MGTLASQAEIGVWVEAPAELASPYMKGGCGKWPPPPAVALWGYHPPPEKNDIVYE